MNTNTEIKTWQERVTKPVIVDSPSSIKARDAEITDLRTENADLRAEVARLQAALAEQDAQLAKKPCQYARCVEHNRLTAALAEREILRTVLEVLRNYPDFDDPKSQFARMIDEALAGKSPWLLEAMDCLAVGVKPPPQPELDAKQVQGELPPLPEPVDEIAAADGFNVLGCQDVFTADQMQAYARAAIAQRVGCGEPVEWRCKRICQTGKILDGWEHYNPASAKHLMGLDGYRPNDSMTQWEPLYTTPPAAVTDADKRGAWHMVCGDWKDEHVALHGTNGHITSGLTIEQAQALIAAHNEASIDAERLDFIAAEKCIIDHYPCADGTTKFALSWPYAYTEQDGLHSTPREAIDAAIAASEQANKREGV